MPRNEPGADRLATANGPVQSGRRRKSLGAVTRDLWLFMGFGFSAVTFLKLAIVGATLFGVLALQGVYPAQVLARAFSHPQTLIIPFAMAYFPVYWCSVVILSYQFKRGRRLSTKAGAIVALGAAAYLVLGQPWTDAGLAFLPSRIDLVHIAFLLGLLLYAVHHSDSMAPQGAKANCDA